MIGPTRISSVAIGRGHDWQGGIIGKDVIGWRHNQKGHRPSDRHQDRLTHLLTMSSTHEIAAALSNPTNDDPERLDVGKRWDHRFYVVATETLREIMTCPLCGGPIKIAEGRDPEWLYEVECDGNCQPSVAFSVPPWFGPFFAQYFEGLLEMNRAFFERYSQNCPLDVLKEHKRVSKLRTSHCKENAPIR